jgi:hypothetical protein
MKKIVLSLSLCLLASLGMAQVTFYVQAPSPNEGSYDFTYAEPGTWGVADLTDPANSVLAPMMLIEDGSGDTNPEGCTGGGWSDMTGHIAVLYRGTCEFGTKALNAQTAGAEALIIINSLPGAPVGMGAGADGGAVTIPVVMISAIDGELLRDEIEAGETEVFIGSKEGLYANDMGFSTSDYLRAQAFGHVQLLNQDEFEFTVEMGSWVRNHGTNEQTGVVLNCTVTLEGTELYNESSDPATVASGDSLWIPLPTFSQPSYANGYYEVMYTVSSAAADEADYDNSGSADFAMSDDTYSMAALDPVSNVPVNNTNQFNGTTDNLYSCLFFQDPNASRVGVSGMNFSAGTSQVPDETSLDGMVIEFYVYEWLDAWVDLDDPAFNITALNDIADAEYIYTENLQSENISVEFEEPVILEDDVKYMFCAQMYGADIYPGYDTKTNYDWNIEEYRMPTSPIYLSGQWYALGFGGDRNPSLSVKMFNSEGASLVEMNDVKLTAYPNPATEIMNIPVAMKEGNIDLTIVDINGRVVAQQTVSMTTNRLEVDVTMLPAGTYIANLEFADGERGTLNFVVSR